MAKAANAVATHVATMQDDNVYRRTNARMFKSAFIEFFSKTPPIVPVLLFGPVVAYFTYVAISTWGVAFYALMFFFGVFAWTFAEYVLHRGYFHMKPSNALKRFLYFYSHGIHHAYPDDYYRLVMIPTFSIPLAFAFYALFSFLFPPEWIPGMFSGFVSGYLVYDYAHFATHHINPPRAKWLQPVANVMKAQRRRHMKHHFEEHDTGYGVSTVFWDIVFGTKSKSP